MSERPPGATRGRLAGWLALVVVLTALNYSSRLVEEDATATDGDLFYSWALAVGTVVQFGIMLAVVLWIARGAPARELLAWRPPRSWPAALGWALLAFVAIFAVGAALEPLLDAGEEQGLTPDEWQPDRAAPFAVNVLLTATFVPVVEELVFRGAGVSLLARYGTATAVIVTGVLFGAAHGLVRGLPVLVAFGIALALLRLHTKSVWPAILVHGVFNLVVVISTVTVGAGG